MIPNIQFEGAAQGLCLVRINKRHVASIATTPTGRWKLYAVKYSRRHPMSRPRPIMQGETVDVTDIFYHHDKLRAAVLALSQPPQ